MKNIFNGSGIDETIIA